jgi:hypothetical protein
VNNSRIRKTSIPLESFSNDKKYGNTWHPNGTDNRYPSDADSQEEMVKRDDAHAITVKNDVVSAKIMFPYCDESLLLTCFCGVDCLIY